MKCVGCEAEMTGRKRKFCSRSCRTSYKVQVSCPACGEPFFTSPYWPGKTCSRKCGQKMRARTADPYRNQRKCAKRRARMFTADAEDVDPSAVFDRDGWTCYICGGAVSREGGRYAPNYPTLDHVIPLARGGSHTYANIRCACLRCNVEKGAPDGRSRTRAKGPPVPCA